MLATTHLGQSRLRSFRKRHRSFRIGYPPVGWSQRDVCLRINRASHCVTCLDRRLSASGMERVMTQVFREKSLARMSSPEQLDQYIHVSNPSVWVILGAIVLLLLGGIVWSCVGTIAEREGALVVVNNGVATVYAQQDSAQSMAAGQTFELASETAGVERSGEGILGNMRSELVLSDDLGSQATDSLGASAWLVTYDATLSSELPDGTYGASVLTSVYHPLALLFGAA